MERRRTRTPYQKDGHKRSGNFIPYGTVPPASNIPTNGPRTRSRTIELLQQQDIYSEAPNLNINSSNNFDVPRPRSNLLSENSCAATPQNGIPVADSDKIPLNRNFDSQNSLNHASNIPNNLYRIEKEARYEIIVISSDDESEASLIPEELPNINKKVCIAVSAVKLYSNSMFAPNIFRNFENSNGLDAVSHIHTALTNHINKRK